MVHEWAGPTSLARDGRRLLKGSRGTGGHSSGTSGGTSSSSSPFNWRALVIALSATFGAVLLVLLLWWLNRRYKAKHGHSMWARRSARVAHGSAAGYNPNAPPPPPPPPPMDYSKIPGVIVLSAHPPDPDSTFTPWKSAPAPGERKALGSADP
ncbi:hypothetical protein HYH02_009875 [Chlamydomonas schloesseri]|uniref:Uncharacterized protein n=1 Tax=Chlamydomonas schloesseri TaxID=2026947 RepID=A0A835TQA0_9CHLO|nr:hypothetical protein HYH02_009875 [Chlamydomonas schloesseri]|eukprot:KAG2442085.1 hypothetical protein HYH02_009875 [Chlamydomonas schloesseri]